VPRLRDLQDRRFAIIGPKPRHTILEPLLGRPIRIDVIQENWDDVVRLAASIKAGSVAPSLNVLLSFAQFEREVTGERIRDKIAASKAKGLRMGGHPPLGYDVVELRPVINPTEAERVCGIFQRFLEIGSVTALAADLEASGIRSKRWINREGVEVGGYVFTRGALQHLLTNPVYRGVNRQKKLLYENSHPAIVDEALWDAVQAKLVDNATPMPVSGGGHPPCGVALFQVHTKPSRFLIVVEAIKVEHALLAPFDGVIETMSATIGDQVVEGRVLITPVAAD
jgi:hypothetical protein